MALFVGCDRSDTTVRSFGPLRMGDTLPSFTGVSDKGIAIGPTTPRGHFYVHVVNDALPPSCLDQECGPEGAIIVAQGGHLMGGSDGKLAKAFGVNLVSGNPYRFDTSLIIVTDDRARVVAIHPGLRLADAPEAARQAGYGSPRVVSSQQ